MGPETRHTTSLGGKGANYPSLEKNAEEKWWLGWQIQNRQVNHHGKNKRLQIKEDVLRRVSSEHQ